MNEIEALSECC